MRQVIACAIFAFVCLLGTEASARPYHHAAAYANASAPANASAYANGSYRYHRQMYFASRSYQRHRQALARQRAIAQRQAMYRNWRYRHAHQHRALQARPAARSEPKQTYYAPSSSSRPSCFWTARAQGGPCGCWAEWNILGQVAHVLRDAFGEWNPWLADDWRRHFPHVSPELATAAVWPGRHVAPVVPGTYKDGTIVVRDSWATHRVRTAGLVFVRTSPISHKSGIKWMSGALG